MIALPLLTLVPGVIGGSETYARELTRALAATGELDYRVLAPSIAPSVGNGLPVSVVPEYAAATTTRGRLGAMARAAARPGPLRRHLLGADAVHFPLTVPIPRTSLPTAVTLHDTQHVDLPQLFSRSERAFRRLAYDGAARRADRVVVVSEFVRARAIERLGLDERRVVAIHSGVDHERFRPGAETREPLLLYPARPWPHKNHARLFAAFAILRRALPELRLVLTGDGHTGGPVPDGVEVRGNVSLEELASLYRRAACLVFPSLYEGFGLPPLEAMASGCPVAASSVASLPEVCGDAAVLFDPLDPEAIAAGVTEALDRSDELRSRGLARAATFTWEASARAHEAVYRALS
jgi:glycosyltransferase involved in cell wall biosynthesis